MLEKATVEIRGLVPMLMHRVTTEALEGSQPGKRKKKDAKYFEEKRQEWRETAYWDEELGLYIPSMNLEACLIEASKGERMSGNKYLKPLVQAGLFVEEPRIGLDTPDDIRSLDDIERLGWVFTVPVRIKSDRIPRRRVKVPPKWRARFTVLANNELLSQENVEELLEKAGTQVGLMDWRPKFGRFEVVSVRWH